MPTTAPTAQSTSDINRDAGFTGLGAAEFAALAMHENTASSALTLSALGIADDALEALLTPIGMIYGRSSLAARSLLSVDGDDIEPMGIGRLVAHAAANARAWMTLALVDGQGAGDSLLAIDAPGGALLIVRRALTTFQVAPADLANGRASFVWDVLERHFAEAEDGTAVVGTVFPDGSASKLALIRLDPDHEDRFEVAVTDELDEQPADAVLSLDEDELDELLAALLRGPDALDAQDGGVA